MILARYVAPGKHRKEHMDAAKRVLRYLCSTSGMGLVLGGRARVVLRCFLVGGRGSAIPQVRMRQWGEGTCSTCLPPPPRPPPPPPRPFSSIPCCRCSSGGGYRGGGCVASPAPPPTPSPTAAATAEGGGCVDAAAPVARGSVAPSARLSRGANYSCSPEIYAGAMAQELRWLTYLLTDLEEAPRSPSVLYVDNKDMIALCQEHRLEHRTKHIALRYFLARELQQHGQLRLAYVATQATTADIFTKALQPCDHQRLCTMLGLVPTWPHLLTS
ncbi:unnamed protein product [Closterium sp. NIES-54]